MLETEVMHILEYRAQQVVGKLEEAIDWGKEAIHEERRPLTQDEERFFMYCFRGKLLDVLVERDLINPCTHVYEGFENRRGR